jgi:ligand-binding sensor domain-containing protein
MRSMFYAAVFTGILLLSASCDARHEQKSDNDTTKNATVVSAENVRCILQDSHGAIWFGSDGGGLYRYQDKRLVSFTEKDGLCNNQVRTIQEDNKGNIWLGTGNGICRYNSGTFSTIGEKEIYTSVSQNVKWEKQRGDLWFAAGAFKGVYRYSNGVLYNYVFPEAEHNGHASANNYDGYDVYCILEDREGNVWFGTQSMGVCCFDGRNFKWIKDKGLDSAAVRAIFQDRTGNMWFGNNGYGLYSYDGHVLTNVTNEKGLGNPEFIKKLGGKEGTLARVWAIDEDYAGLLWIGTIDAGVWRYDGKQMANYTDKNGLTDIGVTAVYKDKSGALWIGTAAETCKFNGHSFDKVIFQ